MNQRNSQTQQLTKRQLLARKLAAKKGSKPKTEIPKKPNGVKTPLSPHQTKLWLLNRINPQSTAYNLVSTFKIIGEMNIDAFSAALDQLEERHEVLRTVFRESSDGSTIQKVMPKKGAPFELIDCRDNNGQFDQELTENTINHEANLTFDFAEGPLWKLSLLRCTDNEWRMIINVHHVIFDGWSLGLFVRELLKGYGEYQQNGFISSQPLSRQYADYTFWNIKRLSGSLGESQKEFWSEYLKGYPYDLALPYDYPRSDNHTSKGATTTLVLDTELERSFCAVGKTQGITPYNMFMAALVVLLNRYTGHRQMVLGSPVSCREIKDTQPLIGILSNTIPVAVDIDTQDTFIDFLKKVHARSTQALQHPDLPFDSIVEQIKPDRSSGANPIFQVFYAYQAQVNPGEVAGLDLLYEIRDYGTAKFDLSLDVMEGPQGPSCIFEYDSSLFSAEKIEQLVRDFKLVVQQIAEQPSMRVHDILLTSDQPASYDSTKELPLEFSESFARRFASIVQQTPTATALVSADKHFSYAELDQISSRVATALLDKVKPKEIIALALPRNIELIVGILASQKLGCAFLSLDSHFPPERLEYMLNNSQVNTIISSKKLLGAEFTGIEDVSSKLGLPLLNFEQLLSKTLHVATESLEKIAEQIQPNHPAYVVYTSGTTGKPKGVVVSQRNWLNALYGWQEVYALNQSVKNHLQMAHFTFDVFCGDFIRAFGSGGNLVICQKETFAQPDLLYQLIQDQKIHCAEFVPAIFRPLAKYLQANELKLDCIDVLIVASDSWYQGESQSFAELIRPDAKLINSYGMVEATIDSTWFIANSNGQDQPGALSVKQSVPIGEPFPNVDILVFDEQMRLCPPGVPGEICVGGLGVVEGYLNNTELTKAKFIPNPVKQDEIIYKTGDWGVLRSDGQLILSGRRDHQVKIRGQRVELSEIESLLAKSSMVYQVIVDTYLCSEQTELVAYILPNDANQQFDANILKQELTKSLPLYMVPNKIVAIEEFPLNNSGKVDRKKLAATYATMLGLETAVNYVAPESLAEQIVAGIWSQALDADIKKIGILDNFFSIGGHSLTALQVCSSLEKACNVDVSVADIFSYPTIQSLAGHIDRLQNDEREGSHIIRHIPHVNPDPKNRFEPFPLTEIQQAYWLGRGDTFEFGNISAHSYDEFEVYDIDTALLEKAWNKVVKQHDMLRCIVLPEGTQKILQRVDDYSIKTYDHKDSDQATVVGHFDRIRQNMSHQIIDVQQWPCFDLRVSMLANNTARLHFSTDAIMFDVRSFLTIMTDLIKFYLDVDRPINILDFSFRDYVIAEHELKKGQTYQQAKTYWQQKITNMPAAPQLPLAKQPSQVSKPHFTRLHLVLSPERWAVLKKRAGKVGLTPTGLLLAAYAETLAQQSREPHFSLNLTFLNRKPFHPNVQDVVGEFTSLTMLSVDNRIKPNQDNSFLGRARTIQQDLWRDLEQNDVDGIEVLRQLSRLSGDPARAKMPVVFTSALVMEVPNSDIGMEVKPIHVDGITQTSQVWLDCGVWEEEGCLMCNWDVVKEMYPSGFIENAFAEYEALINRLVDDESMWSRTVTNSLDLRQQSNYPQRITPDHIGAHDTTLVSLFLESVKRQPEAIAVADSAGELSYRNLAEEAYWLASKVRSVINNTCDSERSSIDSDPNTHEIVAVIVDKGREQISSTLGVMMAGAAYLPIDPELPDARIVDILKQAGARQIITLEKYAERFSGINFSGLADIFVHKTHGHTKALDTLSEWSLPQPEDLAYVIFTSGSTGKPKGVMIDHCGAANTIKDINQRFQVTSSDSVLALSALNFDLSVYDIFGLLAAGGRVVVPDNERRLDPSHWYQLIQENGITVWNSVPALAGILCGYAENRDLRINSLRHVLMSGDWIPLSLPERLWSVSKAQLTSLGGATEASIWSILYPIDHVDSSWQSIPYGTAMRNQQIYILDHKHEPCPNWVEGDIYIGGIGLSLGYWGDQEKTDAAFINHPVTHARLYKTGDKGRRLPDGNIEFLGRSDFQVKIQGHRIELGEIEHCLSQLDDVDDAVVCVEGERQSTKSLVAYIVTNEENQFSSSRQVKFINSCRSLLSANLPNYMVPKQFILLDALPLNANGKIDRKNLPAAQHDDLTEVKEKFCPPQTPIQRQLTDIWTELLELDSISIRDNFFLLGGDSMKAMEMLVQINELSIKPVTLACILSCATIEKLADELESEQRAA